MVKLEDSIMQVVKDISKGNEYGYYIISIRPNLKNQRLDWTIGIVEHPGTPVGREVAPNLTKIAYALRKLEKKRVLESLR